MSARAANKQCANMCGAVFSAALVLRVVVLAVVGLSCASSLFAQGMTISLITIPCVSGELKLQVLDSHAGTGIPGSTIEVRVVSTGQRYMAVTDAAGTATLTAVPVAERYDVSATAVGHELGRASIGPCGLLPTHIYTLQIPAGECHPNTDFPCSGVIDRLPAGNGIVYEFAVFDTGSSIVMINNVAPPGVLSDSRVLQLCDPIEPCETPGPLSVDSRLPLDLTVRVWGLGAVQPPGTIDENGNDIGLLAPLNDPEGEVSTIQVRPSETIVPTLMGGPITARAVASIDYATLVSRQYPFGTVYAPDIQFNPECATDDTCAPFRIPLTRRGSFDPAADGASVGPRFMMETATLEAGSLAATGAEYGFLYDTGSTVTSVTEEFALALGINPAVDQPDHLFTVNTVNGPATGKGYLVDRFTLTTADGLHRYTVDHPIIYVVSPLQNPTRPPFPEGIDVVVGANYFFRQRVIFDGPRSALGLFAAADVSDTVAPALTVPGPITVNATSAIGAVVAFLTAATDNADAHPTTTCAPASGSVFPIGRTTVVCTATDSSGNTAQATFDIYVRSAAEQLIGLIDTIRRMPILEPYRTRLVLLVTQFLAQPRNVIFACRVLSQSIAAIQALPSTILSAAMKQQLKADLTRISGVLGCS